MTTASSIGRVMCVLATSQPMKKGDIVQIFLQFKNLWLGTGSWFRYLADREDLDLQGQPMKTSNVSVRERGNEFGNFSLVLERRAKVGTTNKDIQKPTFSPQISVDVDPVRTFNVHLVQEVNGLKRH